MSDFSQAEYQQRLTRVRERMQSQGLSALLVSDPANIYYVSGYNAWSFYMPQLLVVPASGDPALFVRQIDVAGGRRTTWLPDDRIIGYPEALIHRRNEHPFDWVAGALRDLAVVGEAAGGQVGLELDAHYFSPRAYLALTSALPEWSFTDSRELVNWVRLVKSPAEIDRMRIAAAICTTAMETAAEHIRVGTRQSDAAAEISRAQLAGTPSHGGDYPAIVPLMPMGEAADSAHLTWTEQPFANDQAVSVELAGVYQRYHVPLARTITLGRQPGKLYEVAATVGEGIDAVLDAVRPGVPARRLAEAWNAVLARHGLSKNSRIGYPIGIGYPPDWGERTASLRADDETVLEENMTFHLMCGMWMDGYGYECSESFRVSADGVEVFTTLPRELIPARNQR